METQSWIYFFSFAFEVNGNTTCFAVISCSPLLSLVTTSASENAGKVKRDHKIKLDSITVLS